jgi:hypothetical protein
VAVGAAVAGFAQHESLPLQHDSPSALAVAPPVVGFGFWQESPQHGHPLSPAVAAVFPIAAMPA